MAKADRKNTAVVLNLDDLDELTRRPISSFRSLEAELTNLCRADHHTSEEPPAKVEARIAKAEARIKAICNLVNCPGFSERFIRLLRKRWRSSVDWVEYDQERNCLLLRLRALPAAEEHRRQCVDATSIRDRQMAREFLQKRNSPSYKDKDKSVSVLKADIGKRHGLVRSASIAAVNRGLKSLIP